MFRKFLLTKEPNTSPLHRCQTKTKHTWRMTLLQDFHALLHPVCQLDLVSYIFPIFYFFFLFIYYYFFFFAAVILVAVLFLLAASCWRVSVKTMFQEEPPDMLYKKSLRACNFVKKRLQHRCFPVNYAKFSRNICERLLLHYEHLSSYSYVFKLKLTEIVLVGYTSQVMIENDIFKWKILRKI